MWNWRINYPTTKYMAYDRLPDHLTRLSYVEEKESVKLMKLWALVNASSVSEFIRTATGRLLDEVNADKSLTKLGEKVTAARGKR